MTKEEKSDAPVIKGDQITNVIGEVGRWQIEKILIVFFAAAPGIVIFVIVSLTKFSSSTSRSRRAEVQ